MNLQMSRTAYARPEAPVRSPRAVEYDLLARTTQRLALAWAQREKDFPGLVAALSDNQRVWSAFAVDVADPANPLPAALRARLFYLYEFTAHHSRKVLEDGASPEVLTDINIAVMRGLRSDGATG
ncbi:MAG: flagellar biosynthesis regulatory protein FlaF [Pseudomonadota bacterium]|jgi:flagellar biosynthesis activator protein FlaF